MFCPQGEFPGRADLFHGEIWTPGICERSAFRRDLTMTQLKIKSGVDRRQFQRFIISPRDAISVQLSLGVKWIPGQLLNVTPHGVGIQCSDLETDVGASVRIKLELGQQLAIRQSVVRHQSSQRFGLEFISKDEVSMDQIQKMISTMEIMRELRNRKKHGA